MLVKYFVLNLEVCCGIRAEAIKFQSIINFSVVATAVDITIAVVVVTTVIKQLIIIIPTATIIIIFLNLFKFLSTHRLLLCQYLL